MIDDSDDASRSVSSDILDNALHGEPPSRIPAPRSSIFLNTASAFHCKNLVTRRPQWKTDRPFNERIYPFRGIVTVGWMKLASPKSAHYPTTGPINRFLRARFFDAHRG